MANTEKIVVQVIVQGEKDLQRVGKTADKSTKSFGKMAAGVLGAVAAFKQISNAIGNAMKSFRDFEFQMAKVKAITGANRTEFLKLSKSAQDLGRSTFFTAQQVAELQTNYGKLGFTTQEILNAQEATLMLATATDSDLARAAVVAGSAVRGFGLDASETQRVVDVMAVAFTSSALDIEKFQTSMTKVAPIAKSAGFSIEDTTAIMSQLADSGIEASIAGTSLRNILLKMQDPNSDLVKSFGKTIHSLDELVPALSKFSKEGGSLAEIMEVVDLRQAAAFEQMITSRERTIALRDALKDANGAAEEMARIVGDTLEGAFKRAESAGQGFQIGFMSIFSDSIKNVVDDFTSFVNKLTDFIDIPVSDKLNEDRIAMNDLFNALQNSNISQDTRNKLITELNLKYGEYLPNIVTEKTNLEDLKKAQVEANAAMLQRVTILAAEEKLTEIRKRQIDNEIEAATLAKEQSESLREQTEARINTNERLKTSLSGVDVEMSNANMAVKENTNDLRINKEEADKLAEEYATAATAALELGVDVDALVKSLNISTGATNKSTTATTENTKAKELNNDVDKEMLDFRVTQMMMGYLNEEEIAQLQADLKKREIQDLRNLLKVQGDVGINRMAIAQRIFDLEKDLNKQSQEDKDKAFAEDIKRAALSGESAEDAAKRLIRAKIMEAVSLYIVGAFSANPLFGAIVAAGAGSLISGVFENAFSNITFANGGMIQEFANGGLVHGKSHAQGGEKFAVGGRVVELEGGEAVINKRSTAMFGRQLSAMNAAGGGVKFADGGLLNQPSFSQQQFNAIGQNQMMGAMGSSGKVVVVEADITDSQNSVSVIQSEATI
jgi:TP901 family phage tail tape measure protein